MAGHELSDIIRSVIMMSYAGAGLVFKPGLEVIPLGALPDPVGAPELEVGGADPAGAPELETEGAVEPAGAGVSPPVAEASADIRKGV